ENRKHQAFLSGDCRPGAECSVELRWQQGVWLEQAVGPILHSSPPLTAQPTHRDTTSQSDPTCPPFPIPVGADSFLRRHHQPGTPTSGRTAGGYDLPVSPSRARGRPPAPTCERRVPLL